MRNLSYFIVLFCFILSIESYSQNKKIIPDNRLIEVYGSTIVNDMLKGNPKKIEYLNYYLDNCYYVVSLNNSKKPIEGLDIKSVTNKKNGQNFGEKVYIKEKFNVLKYNFNTGDFNALTYIWKEVGIAIVFRPEKHVKEDFEKSYKTNE